MEALPDISRDSVAPMYVPLACAFNRMHQKRSWSPLLVARQDNLGTQNAGTPDHAQHLAAVVAEKVCC